MPVAKQHAVRMLIGIAAIFGFRLFSSDVTQAYLQSIEKLQRDIYIKPPKEFMLDPDQLLLLLKPLYGLAESGDYWGRTFRFHLLKELNMKSCISDAALFYKKLGTELMGLCSTYVDDTLHAGTDEYSDLCKKTETKFKCKNREYDNTQFAGLQIEKATNGFEVHQKQYIQKLNTLNYKSTYSDFRSTRAKLAWTTNTRPDISCAVALLTHVTEDIFNKEPKVYFKKVNNITIL